jgi:hypothetical protein
MIGMSRTLAFAAALATLASAGCSQTCGAAACLPGVGVSFVGFAPGTYDVEIVAVTSTSGSPPTITCTMMLGGPGPVSCSSSEAVSLGDNQLQIDDPSLTRIQVTVSSNGAQVTRQTLDPHDVPKEINGPGCGVCTNPTFTVTPDSSTRSL